MDSWGRHRDAFIFTIAPRLLPYTVLQLNLLTTVSDEENRLLSLATRDQETCSDERMWIWLR